MSMELWIPKALVARYVTALRAVVASVAVFAGGTVPRALAQPTVTGIGSFPGGFTSDAQVMYGLNQDGSVAVGWSSIQQGGSYRRAFRWTLATGPVNLGVLSPYNESWGIAVDAAGTTVVGYCSYFDSRAMRWNAVEGMQFIPLPGATQSKATDISDDGTVIVGGYSIFPNSFSFRWTVAGGMQSLPPSPSGTAFGGSRVSGDGLAVIGTYSIPGGNGWPRGCCWTAERGMEDLGVLPGLANTLPMDVSRDGSVIVGYCSNATLNQRPFRWTRDNGLEALPIPAGFSDGKVLGVSADGSVVVGSCWGGVQNEQAVLWLNEREPVKLSNYAASLGLVSNPLSFWRIEAISGDGTAVAGYWNWPGQTQSFVMNGLPPAPCNPADLGKAGGVRGADRQLDNNDFIVFIDRFFAADPIADRGRVGGVPGRDGVFDNNDFVVFIDLFFAGCP